MAEYDLKNVWRTELRDDDAVEVRPPWAGSLPISPRSEDAVIKKVGDPVPTSAVISVPNSDTGMMETINVGGADLRPIWEVTAPDGKLVKEDAYWTQLPNVGAAATYPDVPKLLRFVLDRTGFSSTEPAASGFNRYRYRRWTFSDTGENYSAEVDLRYSERIRGGRLYSLHWTSTFRLIDNRAGQGFLSGWPSWTAGRGWAEIGVAFIGEGIAGAGGFNLERTNAEQGYFSFPVATATDSLFADTTDADDFSASRGRLPPEALFTGQPLLRGGWASGPTAEMATDLRVAVANVRLDDATLDRVPRGIRSDGMKVGRTYVG